MLWDVKGRLCEEMEVAITLDSSVSLGFNNYDKTVL
jgi:hypothetical protein